MNNDINDEIQSLIKLSDLKEQEINELLLNYQVSGQSKILFQKLIGRCIYPKLRNTQKPPGEIYATLVYDKDLMIKLVKKPSWGGYILALTVWDLLVIDIDDDEFELDSASASASTSASTECFDLIKQNIEKYYPTDLFYINKTRRGYHLYLISRFVSHTTKMAIFMRMKLNSDPAHGTNSLYTGASIRLSRKQTDPIEQTQPSKYLTQLGSGQPNPEALALYNRIQLYLEKYGNYYPDEIVGNRDRMLELRSLRDYNSNDFGAVHINVTAPMEININGELVLKPPFREKSQELEQHVNITWSNFVKYRVIKEEKLPYILMKCQQQMCMNNLYRIFESTNDYAIGVHLQECCYFIAYRDLLVIDYDYSRLGLLARFVRTHADYTFRIVKTNKGYHAFLTSKSVDHKTGINLLIYLAADPMHIVGTYFRGYSVRINKKKKDEPGYKELHRIGKAPEDPRLVALYQKHLELYSSSNTKPIHQYQRITAQNILEQEGII